MLYIVSTPIGNLEDITYRAVRVLSEVDVLAAEDTRRTAKILNHYKIREQNPSLRTISYNDHNKEGRTKQIISLLLDNKTVALTSDAGTPGINDPCFYLVREALKNNITVSPIPGPTSPISALVSSGLPTDRFTYYGFLPKKSKARQDLLSSITTGTSIFLESPHRIIKALKALSETLPDSTICIAREMTKVHEEFIMGIASEIYERYKSKVLRGEIVLLVSPKCKK
ncbi:16S rRNA (cytidine(1402)-2'-O)-methyltransferase [Candidatus Woesearchaeota archaeon]|nr:16S rRNA (cytidine(1402)-2'-O)-methyltransferase [Candidatus Woesearchaeota archaeon]